MIEFKIDSVDQEDEEKKTIVRLELKQTRDKDGVLVRAIFENGVGWDLLRFNSNGTFEKYNFIPINIGFEVNEKGCLKEQK